MSIEFQKNNTQTRGLEVTQFLLLLLILVVGTISMVNGQTITVISPLHLSDSQFYIQVANSTESGYLTDTDWNTFNNNLNETSIKPFLLAPNQKYVDFYSGSDVTGDGSQFTPWKSLQHAYDSITPFFNDPITLFVIGQYDTADTTTITAKPNVNLVGLSGQPVIPFNFVIVGGGLNDITYFYNLIIQGSITWIRNDIYAISLYLFNVAMNGIVNFQQQGAGRSASFFDASVSFISGFTVQAGQVTLSACQGYGSFEYLDSGSSVYCLIQSGDYYAANFIFSGGIQAQFSGILADVGMSIATYTTGSGTPNIVTDSSSIPPSITGPGILSFTSQSNYINYNPATSSDWTRNFGTVPSLVSQALDLICTGDLNGIFKDNFFSVVAATDATKKVKFSVQGNSGYTTTILTNSSYNRVLMTPDYNGIVLAASTDAGSTLGQVFIGANQSLPYISPSNAGLQYSSNILNRGSIRVNQYGNNVGIPGITTFKSRGTNVGDMVGVSDGDVIFRVTAEGATGNLATPLSALISINVPTGGTVNPTFIATEYELQLVSLDSTTTNQRRVVFKINSEGMHQMRETAAFSGQTSPSGIIQLGIGGTIAVANARIVANSRVTLTIQPSAAPPVGVIYVSAITSGIGFSVTSTSALDVGQNIYYQIYIPL